MAQIIMNQCKRTGYSLTGGEGLLVGMTLLSRSGVVVQWISLRTVNYTVWSSNITMIVDISWPYSIHN